MKGNTKKTGGVAVSVSLDTTDIDFQISELQNLLNSALEGVPEDLIRSLLSNLPAVLDDIILSNNLSACGARFEIIHRARLGAKYERFTAAIRAGEFNLESL
ncbi:MULTISPECIES: hypothetical protein [Citrobacter]|uniref:hypothetical protein n=1 Tax=Citrobacter sp. 172116965 TaxID=2683822 RepID=UPI0015DD3B68|nr:MULTISPECIES: hypothetical protein [Citrobacter]ELT7646491.1 hypothetical protein [Citrobacter freundii]MDE9607753.1 hypothetical protein [Citrobacter portucalensis]MDV0580701.1 hypothetical protein [Citrobacter braakii]MEB0652404.1 hypothetical protein [Citrobacter braakii]QLK37851.1 hypothetical protein GPJ68_10010 [Citrobacter sp. 172116965]